MIAKGDNSGVNPNRANELIKTWFAKRKVESVSLRENLHPVVELPGLIVIMRWPDGSVYVSTGGRIRRISPDGMAANYCCSPVDAHTSRRNSIKTEFSSCEALES